MAETPKSVDSRHVKLYLTNATGTSRDTSRPGVIVKLTRELTPDIPALLVFGEETLGCRVTAALKKRGPLESVEEIFTSDPDATPVRRIYFLPAEAQPPGPAAPESPKSPFAPETPRLGLAPDAMPKSPRVWGANASAAVNPLAMSLPAPVRTRAPTTVTPGGSQPETPLSPSSARAPLLAAYAYGGSASLPRSPLAPPMALLPASSQAADRLAVYAAYRDPGARGGAAGDGIRLSSLPLSVTLVQGSDLARLMDDCKRCVRGRVHELISLPRGVGSPVPLASIEGAWILAASGGRLVVVTDPGQNRPSLEQARAVAAGAGSGQPSMDRQQHDPPAARDSFNSTGSPRGPRTPRHGGAALPPPGHAVAVASAHTPGGSLRGKHRSATNSPKAGYEPWESRMESRTSSQDTSCGQVSALAGRRPACWHLLLLLVALSAVAGLALWLGVTNAVTVGRLTRLEAQLASSPLSVAAATSTPAASTPATSTPALSTPAASTPAAATAVGTLPPQTIVGVLPNTAVFPTGNIRTYYLAAEDTPWSFAPLGYDGIFLTKLDPPITNVWDRTRYVEYTDSTFSVAVPQPAWLGIMGPILRAEVGDVVRVHFLNRAASNYTFHPHGLRYDHHNTGSYNAANVGNRGASVATGLSYMYSFYAGEDSGPYALPGSPQYLSSQTWWYHSHVDESKDIEAGLVGAIIVTARGKTRGLAAAQAANDTTTYAELAPVDVDVEFAVMWMDIPAKSATAHNTFYAANGRSFGNLLGINMNVGDRARWHLMTLGDIGDVHPVHFHGKTVVYNGAYTDVIELVPGSMRSVDMDAVRPGQWMVHCHVDSHYTNGMTAAYNIAGSESTMPPGGELPVIAQGDISRDGAVAATTPQQIAFMAPFSAATLAAPVRRRLRGAN